MKTKIKTILILLTIFSLTYGAYQAGRYQEKQVWLNDTF